jgi:hypothetical protein
MDDLKLYASSDTGLQKLLDTVQMSSDAICMSFGLDKCAKITLIRGKIKSSGGLTVSNTTFEIDELDENTSYRYFGIDEND